MDSLRSPGISKPMTLIFILGRHVDDADRAADLRGHPNLPAVRGELGRAGALIHQDVGDRFAGGEVDEMGHVGGFGGVDQPFAVRADPHPLRLHPDLNLGDLGPVLDIDDGHHVVVFVGHIEKTPLRTQGQELEVRARGQGMGNLVGGQVQDLDMVRVAGADVERLQILAERDARGRGPTLTVVLTSRLCPSTTAMVLSCSLETETV
jgi:hypothetical protein